MPLLTFQTTCELSSQDQSEFAAVVTELYTDAMHTTSGHVAVVFETHDSAGMHLGRATEGPLLFLEADIRRGRPHEDKRAFALEVMETAGEMFDIPDPNMKVIFTEHAGRDMMGVDRVGSEWEAEKA